MWKVVLSCHFFFWKFAKITISGRLSLKPFQWAVLRNEAAWKASRTKPFPVIENYLSSRKAVWKCIPTHLEIFDQVSRLDRVSQIKTVLPDNGKKFKLMYQSPKISCIFTLDLCILKWNEVLLKIGLINAIRTCIAWLLWRW